MGRRGQSFRGLPTRGDLSLALQTADQSLNVLKLVYGILHGGLWGQRARMGPLVNRSVWDGAGFPAAARLGALRSWVEA